MHVAPVANAKEPDKSLYEQTRHFNALVEDLGKSLDKFKVPAREKRELVAILAPMTKDIVERR